MKELLAFHLKTLLEQCTGNHQSIYRDFIPLIVDKTNIFNYDSGKLSMMMLEFLSSASCNVFISQ